MPTSAQSPTIYTSSDGTGAWHIVGNRFWSGLPSALPFQPQRDAQPTITYTRLGNVACASLDGVSNFGAPDMLRQGARFQCGTARFEVVDCDMPEDCHYALIQAIWRTGVEPNFSEVPVNYFYNRCRGVQSITFSPDRPLRVGFGTTLELRQGLGLLAQPDAPVCGREPGAGQFGSME